MGLRQKPKTDLDALLTEIPRLSQNGEAEPLLGNLHSYLMVALPTREKEQIRSFMA
jgi:hypothetical protein